MTFSQDWRRTHDCGALRGSDEGARVVLNGWVHTWRNHGGVIFFVLRDRYGITQVVCNPGNRELWSKAESLRHEFVVAVKGNVIRRPGTMANPNMATGEIEVAADDLLILGKAEPLPIQIHNPEATDSEENRLTYRFLDLRRPAMQNSIVFRHRLAAEVRQYLWEQRFVEIETPILMKSTPEGARDFLVPSRLNPGKFYALPQSPQTYKQILMVSGFDRYFQIARCFRDEDLRADRQPEFTQIDAEMSFVTEEDIYAIFEGMIGRVFERCLGVKVELPMPRMSYEEAFRSYGCDKPDTRFGMKITDATALFKGCGFKVFTSVIEAGGSIGAVAGEKCGDFSRRQIDDLTAHVGKYGAKGLVWLRVRETGVESSSAKFFTADEILKLKEATGAVAGDMIFMVAAPGAVCFPALGQLRLELARMLDLLKKDRFSFLWVDKFPMFEYSEEEKRHVSVHHPFTSPLEEDFALLGTDRFHEARARAYDMVLNGTEIGGGSIRIHDREHQKQVFGLLGISEKQAEEKFGFLLRAFKFGAPPHGGLAFGLDRLAMIMLGLDSIRDVIAFPKTSTGMSLMDGAPDIVAEKQLNELKISVNAVGK